MLKRREKHFEVRKFEVILVIVLTNEEEEKKFNFRLFT